jgi:hypothetical protein
MVCINELRGRIYWEQSLSPARSCTFQARNQPHAVPALERAQFRFGTRPVETSRACTIPPRLGVEDPAPYNFCELSAANRELPSEPFAASRRLVAVRGGRARLARTHECRSWF